MRSVLTCGPTSMHVDRRSPPPLHGAPGSRRQVLAQILALGALGAAGRVGATDQITSSNRGNARNTTTSNAAAREAAISHHFPFGDVVPRRRLAALEVHTHQGRRSDLAQLLRGKTTALQLMFTGCNASCPIQGALFAQTQQALGAQAQAGALQLMSLSIDALGDSPQRLAQWLQKFSAQAGWLAVVPGLADVNAVLAVLGAGGQGRISDSDPHPGQVYLINAAGDLVHRTVNNPPAAVIVQALRSVSR